MIKTLSTLLILSVCSVLSFGHGMSKTNGGVKITKEEIETIICSSHWVSEFSTTKKSKLIFLKNGTYKCLMDYLTQSESSIQGLWSIDGNKIRVSFPDYQPKVNDEIGYMEIVDISIDKFIVIVHGEKITFIPESLKNSLMMNPSELASKLSYSKWILEKRQSISAMIEFGKNGVYRLIIDYADAKPDSVLGNWAVSNDELIITFPKMDNFEPSPIKAKVISITTNNLIINCDGQQTSYRSSRLMAPTEYREENASSILLISQNVKPNNKEELYSKFIGTYHLEKKEDIEYDHMTFRFKNGDTKQLECVRKFKFRDPSTNKVGAENTQVYDVVKLDAAKKQITLKQGKNKAVYKFVDNSCGGYDIVVYNKVLIYSCNKQ
jgi:hypothetical protein